MKRAAAYIRVSDERQDEFSPDSQLKLIKDFCKNNLLYLDESSIFYDDGISARRAEARPEFSKMIDIAKSPEHPFDAIVVWKFSRFARNQEESIIYKSMLKKKNVDVLSVSEPIGSDAFGSLVERIIEWMDEYYLVRLSDEVKRGMKEKALRGQPNAAPPIGYSIKNGKIEPIESEAKNVKLIFSLFLSDMTTAQIAKELSKMGIRTRNGKQFESRAIQYILRNPIYAGYTRWSQNGRMASNRQFESPSFITVKGEHPSIISLDDFKRAQDRLNKSKPKSSNQLLYSLLFCSSCGSKMILQSGKTPSYQCSAYAKGYCKHSHSVSTVALDNAVVSALPQALTNIRVRAMGDSVTFGELIGSDEIKTKTKNALLKLFIDRVIFDRQNNSAEILIKTKIL